MANQNYYRPSRAGLVKGSGLAKPAGAPVTPGTNPHRLEKRLQRQAGVQQAANQVQPARPAPLARPAGPPRRVMPAVPAPAGLKAMTRIPPAQAGSATPNASTNAQSALAAEMNALHSSFADLQARSGFGGILSEIAELDKLENRLAELLEAARQKGYVYQSDLDQLIYDLMSRWQSVKPTVQRQVNLQAAGMQNRLPLLNRQVQSLSPVLHNPSLAASMLRSAQSQVNSQLSEVSRIESELRSQISDIDTQAYQLNSRLTQIHWALDQVAQAKFNINAGENLVIAVAARWDKEGKDDPEGVLYLTSRRLIFERKEKVAVKKILFITTASELVQEVILDQPLEGLTLCRAENKGLFGHQDFLALQFSKLGSEGISMHINGQDSKDWAQLIERTKSGQIESERTTAGSSLSIADLSRPLTRPDLLAIQSEVNALQDELMLKSLRQELVELENDVLTLARDLANIRSRGYQVEKNLEVDLAVLTAQWDRIKLNTQATIEYQARQLGEQSQAIQQGLGRLMGMSANLVAARPVYAQLKSAIASAQATADAAESTIYAQYEDYDSEVEHLQAHLEWIDWMLDALATASFQLFALENGIAAVEAVYNTPGGEPENGVMFLTDQRLLWEDRVDAYELKVNIPLQDVSRVHQGENSLEYPGEAERRLVVDLGPSGFYPQVLFQLATPIAPEWVKMISRARSGEYASATITPLSPEELDKIRNAPQLCSTCGAAFSTPLMRGQTELTCEYCGLKTQM